MVGTTLPLRRNPGVGIFNISETATARERMSPSWGIFVLAPAASSPAEASLNPGQPIAPAALAAKPGRQSRLWNAGGPAGLAALEARDAAERQAQLRHAPREASSALARPIGKADGVQPGDACPPGDANFIPRRSGKRPPEVDDPSSWESGWN